MNGPDDDGSSRGPFSFHHVIFHYYFLSSPMVFMWGFTEMYYFSLLYISFVCPGPDIWILGARFPSSWDILLLVVAVRYPHNLD